MIVGLRTISVPMEKGAQMAEYIDRDAAIKAILSEPTDQHYPSWYAENIKRIQYADVAPVVHGHWCWDGRLKACSICGSYVEFTKTLGASYWNFCPNCGAKMDLEEKNDSSDI